MKEFEGRLTTIERPPTLKSEGKIMAQEGRTVQDETAKITKESAEEAAKQWAEQNKAREKRGEKVTAEERQTQRIMAQEGRGPMTGSDENPPEISDPLLTPFIGETRKLFSTKEFDADKIHDLQKKIRETEAPKGYTPAQKTDFERQRQMLLGNITDEIDLISGGRGGKDVVVKSNALIEAMESDDVGVYDRIDEIIEDIDINNYEVYGGVIKKVVEEAQGKDKYIEYILVYGVERILTTADANPLVEYPRFNLYQETSLDSVIQTARRYDEQRGGLDKSHMFKYLSDLRTKRYVMHELFRSMKDRETYVKLVTQLLRKEGMAFVEKDIPGVTDVKEMYEQFMGSDLSFSKDWLTGQHLEKIDKDVQAHLKYCITNYPEAYQVMTTPNGYDAKRALRGWEVERARNMGRALHAASQRRYTYPVLGDMPQDPAILYKSLEAEYISRILAPLKLLPVRFFESPAAKKFLDLVFHQMRRAKKEAGHEELDYQKYGYVGEDGKDKGVYGKTQRALALLDTAVPDPQTNSWRGVNLFLRQKDYKTEVFNGEQMTIGEYLFAVHADVERQVRSEIEAEKGELSDFEWGEMKKDKRLPYANRIKKRINVGVREAIKSQRLFLGTLMRQQDLDNDNKKIIWQNVAEFLPSRMAAFMPDEAMKEVMKIYGVDKKGAIDLWKNGDHPLREKLWILERARIKADAATLKAKTKADREKVKSKLLDYADGIELSSKEVDLIKALQKMGHDKIENPSDQKNPNFVSIKFPYTAFLEDAPQSAWGEIEDDDFDRILIGDHNNFSEGWSKVTSIIANPGAKPDEVGKLFIEAFDKIQQPPGKTTAQEKLWPFVNAYLRMARLNTAAKWVGWLMQATRRPRSEMEKYAGLQTKIAHDEEQTERFLTMMSQHEVVSDVPGEADEEGRTQYMLMKSDNDSDRKAVFLMYVRMVLLLLLPILGKEFFKMILPGDIAKAAGI